MGCSLVVGYETFSEDSFEFIASKLPCLRHRLTAGKTCRFQYLFQLFPLQFTANAFSEFPPHPFPHFPTCSNDPVILCTSSVYMHSQPFKGRNSTPTDAEHLNTHFLPLKLWLQPRYYVVACGHYFLRGGSFISRDCFGWV